jgi:paraquat-inducible protein B
VSARTHPRLVGAFVLGAVALVLAAVVGLSGGGWFERKFRFSVFFPGSVRGLNQGAPVSFRGVKVGEVKDVKAFLTGKEDPLIQIEVVIEVRSEMVEVPEGVERPYAHATAEEMAKGLIQAGVRARMMSGSLLTGQRYIELDFLPGKPARFAGLRPRYPELPTTPTSMEELSAKLDRFVEKLAELPLDQMLDDVERVIASLRALLESPDLAGALAGAHRSMKALEPALVEARRAVEEARRLIASLETEARDAAGETRLALAEARATLGRADRTLDALEKTLRGTDEARMSAAETLEEMQRTLKALRSLVDYVQTHPEAVVLGKPQQEKK